MSGAGRPALVRRGPLEALEEALSLCEPEEVLCITGSLYLVGALRERWHPMALDSSVV